MNVTQVVQEFSRKGGIECVAFELQQAWRDAGVNAQVVAGIAPGSEQRTDVTLLSAPFRDIATRGKLGKYLGRPFVIPAFTLTASKYIRKHPTSGVVVSHGDCLVGDVMIIHAVNKQSLKEKQKEGSYKWMLNPMHWWVGARDRYMISGLRFKYYVALSNRVKQEIMELYNVPENRVVVIPNGVNAERYNPEGPGFTEVRSRFNVPINSHLLLFVGHEFGRKGLAPIIQAMGHMAPNVYLLVVGNDDKTSYEKIANEVGVGGRVIFAGPQSNLPEIYRASDAFVFPTAYEAFGLVTMEALASGVPIFSTRVGGIEDYLKDGVNGRFITRDPKDIASKLSNTFLNPDAHAKMILAARASALDYTWDKIARQYIKLFETV